MKLSKLQIGITVVLGALLAVGVLSGLASAQAQPSSPTPAAQSTSAGPHPVKLAGKVSSISTSSFSLTTPKGDYTVNITANTWVVVQKNGAATQGTISDLVSGKAATVAGMTTPNSNVVDARLVAQGNFAKGLAGKTGVPGKLGGLGRQALAQHASSGTITSINGNSVVLKGAVVPVVNVQTSADTIVFNNGFAGTSTLKVGDKVQVFGRPVKATGQTQRSAGSTPGTTPGIPSSRTIDAWAIRVDNGTSQLLLGRVTAINGNVLTLKTPAHKNGVTLNVDSSTGYKVLSSANKAVSLADSSLSAVKVGSNLIVEAVPSSDGQSFAGKAVVLLPGKTK